MKTILVGNLSNLNSVSLLADKLTAMANYVDTAVDKSNMIFGEQSGQKSGLSDFFIGVMDKLIHAEKHISSFIFVPVVEHLFTFRMGGNIFTIVTDTQQISSGNFDFSQQLKNLELVDFQKINLLVEFKSVSLPDRLKSMQTDVLTIKGSDIRFRAKHIIKPAQPGQEHLNSWTDLTDAVSIVVTRLSDNKEAQVQAALAHLKDVLENSDIFEVDKDKNILINL